MKLQELERAQKLLFFCLNEYREKLSYKLNFGRIFLLVFHILVEGNRVGIS